MIRSFICGIIFGIFKKIKIMQNLQSEIMEVFTSHDFFDETELKEWETKVLPDLPEESLQEIKDILSEYLVKHEEINIKYELEKEEILKQELHDLKEILRNETHQAVLRMRKREEDLRKQEEVEMGDLEAQLANA